MRFHVILIAAQVSWLLGYFFARWGANRRWRKTIQANDRRWYSYYSDLVSKDLEKMDDEQIHNE